MATFLKRDLNFLRPLKKDRFQRAHLALLKASTQQVAVLDALQNAIDDQTPERVLSISPGLGAVDLPLIQNMIARNPRVAWHSVIAHPGECNALAKKAEEIGIQDVLTPCPITIERYLRRTRDDSPFQLILGVHAFYESPNLPRLFQNLKNRLAAGGEIWVVNAPDAPMSAFFVETQKHFNGVSPPLTPDILALAADLGLQAQVQPITAYLDASHFDKNDDTPDLLRDFIVNADMTRMGLVEERRIFQKILDLPKRGNERWIIHDADFIRLRHAH